MTFADVGAEGVPGVVAKERLVRRFPGPAGFMPQSTRVVTFGIYNSRNPPPPPTAASKDAEEEDEKLRDLQQMLQDLPFKSPTWLKMLQEHEMEEDALEKFSLKRVTRGAKPFTFRLAPLLYLILIRVNGNRGFLRDRSASAEADFWPEVLQSHGGKLRVGNCFVLNDTTILCGKTSNCLLVKEENILCVYEDEAAKAVEQVASEVRANAVRAAIDAQARWEESENAQASASQELDFPLRYGLPSADDDSG